MIDNTILEEASQLLQHAKKQLKPQQSVSDTPFADIIFKNADIVTMATQLPQTPTFITIKNGNIQYLGANQSQIQAFVCPQTQVIDLQGKTLLPGFIDPHIHFVYAGLGHWTDLSPFLHPTMEQVWKAIVQTVKSKQKPEDWAMFHSYDTLLTKGQKLDLSIKTLDELSDRPIFIMESNGHIAYANSAAFFKSGVGKDTLDPPHSRFCRDQSGNLTGVVEEVPAINVIEHHSPALSAAQYLYYTQQFFRLASSKGCTSLHDCGIGAYSPELDYKIINVAMKSDPCVRFSGFLVAHAAKYWDSLGLKPERKDKIFRITGMKFWADGSLQAGSGYLREPYSCCYKGKGIPNYPSQMLNTQVLKAHSQGWQIGIHGNGDAAIDMLLEAYEYAQTRFPRYDARHRIEHCTVCRGDQFKKMQKLSLTPSFLIGHVYYYGEFFQKQLLGKQRKIDALKTALDNNLRITLHSDYRSQPIDPLRCIYNAVTRKSYTSDEIINEEERISVYQALKAMTIDAAWQCHMDDIVGSLQVGKCADFVILDVNPLKSSPEDIIKIQVLQTWMGGKLKHQKF